MGMIATWTDGRFNYEVDLDLGKTRITRISDGAQNVRNSNEGEIARATEILAASADAETLTLREQFRQAWLGLRAINEDRNVTWPELRDALPPALAALRQLRDAGTQDLETQRYAVVLQTEIIESLLWVVAFERDARRTMNTEVLALRQDFNAHAVHP
jgi:hypothetical protein